MEREEYPIRPEVILYGVNSDEIPEVKVEFNTSDIPRVRIRSSGDAADFIRNVYPPNTIELQEQFIILYLDRANQIRGYYKHSIGGIAGTVADPRIILAVALKSLSTGIILAHNHPSGNLKPSEADIQITKKIREAAKFMDIDVLDHVILTKNGHYSFADEGQLQGYKTIVSNKEEFTRAVETELEEKVKHNKTSIEKLAVSFGITDKTEVKELTELAIVRRARQISHKPFSIEEKFNQIVELYNSQVNLSHRTSHSILLQQYSTPAPIGFLAGIFTGADKNIDVFEPSAGNGLLTIVANPENVTVNEIDDFRRGNLETQGFKEVFKQDASIPFKSFEKKFDAVITNPPFGPLGKEIKYETFGIKTLDHLMALRALDTMKDHGKAAIIIGGHTSWDEKGRIQAGKNRIFFNYLYSRYEVADVINIDGHKLYSRQGTAFNVRLILINGRKAKPEGVAPVRDKANTVVMSFEELYERVMEAMDKEDAFEKEALRLERELLNYEKEELGAPYQPASSSCIVLNTVVPDSMEYETHSALESIKQAVGGDMDEFVKQRLHYRSKTELCKALSAEQIDAVAMAIYNIEARGQGMIIGDQTGIGKGRVAASMIRYGVKQGYKPIFITEKANLFSDMYRDLVAIGSHDLVPFIINGRESKTEIKDENGNLVYQALAPTEQSRVFQDMKIPGRYDFVVGTYSQFNSAEKKPEKPAFLSSIAEGNILILDESHNSSGSSNTGEFMQKVVSKTKGVVFLSATFAKRPDNMPVYAMKTVISEASMTKEQLVEAITKGGVALQEVLASQLVAEGQMLRRERSFEGVEVNYITLDKQEAEHKAISDSITEILRDIIGFQTKYIDEEVKELDDIAVAEGEEVTLREGTSQAGVDNTPYFSKVFNVINQMLFSIKAESVADRAIQRLKEGKKPVIAFASTMGSFIEQMENKQGLPVGDGDIINADFSEVLLKGLDGVMRYTVTGPDGEKEYRKFELSDFPEETRAEYQRVYEKIKTVASGITISPIDIIIDKIKKAGYTVAEVTGRKYEVQINTKTSQGLVRVRKKVNTNDAFRQFNNNEVDVLLINQSGSTGASAHAIVTDRVSKDKIKQRVMIVLQAELDINTEVQKRGRINRTGQVYKPIYDYVTSAIPAEKRLMMMLQKKLKSLDANTTSNQKQSTKILDVPDFLNKYGDHIVVEYLRENAEINDILDDPLKFKDASSDSEGPNTEDAAYRVSGRVAVLSTDMQQDFYSEITLRYKEYVEYLKQIGEYDLEVEAMDLKAETVSERILKVGKGGESEFGEDSMLETVRANVLKKPFSTQELKNLLNESLNGKDAKIQQKEILEEYETSVSGRLEEELKELEEHYENAIKDIPEEKKIKIILKKEGQKAHQNAIAKRELELRSAQEKAIENIQKKFNNRKQYLEGVFKFFYAGRNLKYPLNDFNRGMETAPAVFVGFMIEKKGKNPYAPSSIRLRFAIANSYKYIAIPASYNEDINEIKGASADLIDHGLEETLKDWEVAIKERTVNRQIRYIITGNLLQAFGEEGGKLVSYTTMDGAVKKGILLPEYWIADDHLADKVTVPISKASKIIKSLGIGSEITTTNGISIFRQPDIFKIIVSASRSKGGEVYLNKEILRIVEKNVFEKVSGKMVARLDIAHVENLIDLLQKEYSASVPLSSFQFDIIKDDLLKRDKKKKVFAPLVVEKSIDTDDDDELELEALALEIELELLNFAA